MEEKQHQVSHTNKRPIIIGVFAVLATLSVGVGIAFATGFVSPQVAKADLVLPPCCTVPPVTTPPPVILPPVLPPPPPPPPVIVPPLPPPAAVCTLTATPTATPIGGGSSTLAWTTEHAKSATLDHGIGAVTPLAAGSRAVNVTSDTTYTLSVIGEDDEPIECHATITVPPPVIPKPICTLTANPTAVLTNTASTLTWTTQNATSFSIDHGIGSVTPVAGGSVSTGNLASNTTFTGTVTGPGGTAQCSASVTTSTNPPTPACVLTASNASITAGGTSVISWSGTNIASVSIDQGIGATTTIPGSITVSPTSNTTYTGTFISTTGQTLSCNAVITVQPVVTGCTSNCGGGGGGGGSRHPKVLLDVLPHPEDNPLAFVYLSQVPYTGVDLGPIGTAVYWTILVLFCAAVAYLVLFNAVPFTLARVRSFGQDVHAVLNNGTDDAHAAHGTHAPVHHAPVAHSAPVAHAAPAATGKMSTYSAQEGFRSFASGNTLTIDDIVHGLARESEHHDRVFDAFADHAAQADHGAHGAEVTTTTQTIIHDAPEPTVVFAPMQSVAPEAPAHAPAPAAPVYEPLSLSDDITGFLSALIAGNRDAVFGQIRQVTRSGEDSELFLTHAVCALDDAYRARIDGTAVHPEVARITAQCHPSFLEKLVGALTTAVDGSYSSGVTGVKLAVTRALAIVNG